MTRVQGNYCVHLWGCHYFYAEVWYKYGIAKIQKIGAFRSIKYLDPYLDKISLRDLEESLQIKKKPE